MPPGPVIAWVWVILLCMMGYAYSIYPSVLLAGLIVFCMSYPMYATTHRLAAVGNRAALLLVMVTLAVLPAHVRIYLWPTFMWVAYVNLR